MSNQRAITMYMGLHIWTTRQGADLWPCCSLLKHRKAMVPQNVGLSINNVSVNIHACVIRQEVTGMDTLQIALVARNL